MLPLDYKDKTPEARIAFWTGVLHQQMRWAAQDGLDRTGIFKPALLACLRADDPDIDTLMPAILGELAQRWRVDAASFVTLANARMGTGYALAPVEPRGRWWQPGC